jgi:hypothetical protein
MWRFEMFLASSRRIFICLVFLVCAALMMSLGGSELAEMKGHFGRRAAAVAMFMFEWFRFFAILLGNCLRALKDIVSVGNV